MRKMLALSALGPLLLLAACSGSSSENATTSRQALYDDGMSDEQIDCLVEGLDLSVDKMVSFTTDDAAAEEYVAGLDDDEQEAFFECAALEGSVDEDEDDESDDPAEDEAALPVAEDRSTLYAAEWTDDDIDCVVETTGLTIEEMEEIEQFETLAGEPIDDDLRNAIYDCFAAGLLAEEGGDASGCTGACDYGDDPEFDQLWDECEAGNGASCDRLYAESPAGSDYEAFGDSCGGRGSEPSCAEVYGDE